MRGLLSTYSLNTIRGYKETYGHLVHDQHLTQQELQIREECEKSFYTFVRHTWNLVDTDSFSDSWHIEAICEHMQGLYDGRFKDLILNLPPRSGKTTICYILFIGWVWAKDPTKSFLCTAYSREVSQENSVKCKQFLSHAWYQKMWGDKVKFGESKRKTLITTRAGGERRATSLHGANMGFGGHFIFIDDPSNMDTITSQKRRKDSNDKVDYIGTSRTRKNIPARLLTQQRVDADDATGHVTRNNNAQGWVHVFIPERFESWRQCVTVPLKDGSEPWCDPRTEDGQLMDCSWRTEAFFKRVQAGMSKYMVQAQYQQNPILPEGNIIDPAWFREWKKKWHPNYHYILQSWDTAFETTEDSAFSACTTWACFEDRYMNQHVMLLDVFSDKLRAPDLRNKAIELDREFQPGEILVEKNASGYGLIHELQNYGLPVTGFNPTPHGNKEKRCIAISGFIEAGYVWIPMEGPDFIYPVLFADKLLNAAQYFPQAAPGSDTADIIDSMSQALTKLAQRSLIANRERVRDPEEEREWNSDTSNYIGGEYMGNVNKLTKKDEHDGT